MVLSADNKIVFIGCGSHVPLTRHVSIIDMKTLKLVNTIKVGRSAHGIYFYNRAPLF
ncbi:hypothetical protein AB4Y32_21910 [Paraburkholderia phymatum]|uniref:Uncharacterized protein n=1 Tax=Paraburkholderia phymatum TaxID=148447 RepID=A0ACC6U4D0_9BURK